MYKQAPVCEHRQHLARRGADQGQRQPPAPMNRVGLHKIATACPHDPCEHENSRDLDRDIERIGRARVPRIGKQQQVERCQQKCDDQKPAARARKLPVVKGVVTSTEYCRGDAGREQKREVRQLFEGSPQATALARWNSRR